MSLRLAVLALLDAEPASGYALLNRFENSIGFYWPTTHQQLYKVLHSLYAEGLLDCQDIEQRGKPDKKVYSLNTEGEKTLDELLKIPSPLGKLRDPFAVKLYAGKRLSTATILAELATHYQLHLEKLATYQGLLLNYDRMPDERRARYFFPVQTLKLGIQIEQVWLDWYLETVDIIQLNHAQSTESHVE